MIKYIIKNHLEAFICMSFTTYMALGFGMILMPALLLLFLYYLPNLMILFIKQKPLKTLTINFFLWILVFGAMTTWHHLLAKEKKRDANIAAVIIEKHFDKYNEYPESLDAFKIQLTKSKFKIFYHYNKNKPTLYYSSNYDPYDKHHYDFIEKEWDFAEKIH